MEGSGRKTHAPHDEGWLRRGWRVWRLGRLLDMPEKDAAQRLARLGFPPLPYLLESVGRMDGKSAKAAYLIGRMAEGGNECFEAIRPLYDMLMDGDEMQKGNSAVALARIGTPMALSMLLAALGDRNNIIRRHAAIGLGIAGDASAESSLRRAAECDCDPEVRRLADNALGQIAGCRQP